jgi:hypothetical protein
MIRDVFGSEGPETRKGHWEGNQWCPAAEDPCCLDPVQPERTATTPPSDVEPLKSNSLPVAPVPSLYLAVVTGKSRQNDSTGNVESLLEQILIALFDIKTQLKDIEFNTR